MKTHITACLAVGSLLLSGALAAKETSYEALRDKALSAYGQLPLSFEANKGQVDSNVYFLGRSQGLTLFLTDHEAVLSVRGPEQEVVVRMHPVGGAPRRPSGSNPLGTRSNYLLGDDPSRWSIDVPHYGQVRYESVYPGVDLVYRGNPRQLEYDFIIAPEADPRQIRLAFQGVDAVAIGSGGELILRTARGDLVQRAPVLYQEAGQERERVEGHYVLLNESGEVGFAMGRYDRARALIIDPIIVYSTFLGGPGFDRGSSIAVDGSGNVYVTGGTSSTSFPGVTPGSFQPATGDSGDAFVTKINSTGTEIVYSTFLGGTGFDEAKGIAVDGAGNAYVMGTTTSSKFPGVTGTSIKASPGGGFDAFVTKINATGNGILYSTFLGGSEDDLAAAIAIDGSGSAYLTGSTRSTSFTGVTPGSLQPEKSDFDDAFVTKINSAGTAIVYSTFLGGNGFDKGLAIAVDDIGNAYITGVTARSTTFPGVTDGSIQRAYGGGESDAFVTKINSIGKAIVYSTFLGGSAADVGSAIAVDSAGNVYVAGDTRSAISPGAQFFTAEKRSIQMTNDGHSVFIAKINAPGTTILYSTFLGGPLGSDQLACCVAVDSGDNAYVLNRTAASIFPGVGAGSIQPANAGSFDFVVTKIDPAGTKILYSTFLGGPNIDNPFGMALDRAGNVHIVGESESNTFSGVNSRSIQAANAGRTDVIVIKLSPLDFSPTHAGGCSVPACQAGTYPCCTSEPICRCRPDLSNDADCTAGGKDVTGCSITMK
ncbi:MAG TPA: SBBP repeat-containing protein [Thermoanaerobaculia bacterium]|nr:SBBP repeat-containing protein [Thermoanaerobaculia bacterium]